VVCSPPADHHDGMYPLRFPCHSAYRSYRCAACLARRRQQPDAGRERRYHWYALTLYLDAGGGLDAGDELDAGGELSTGIVPGENRVKGRGRSKKSQRERFDSAVVLDRRQPFAPSRARIALTSP
jgi:hypothetical protein